MKMVTATRVVVTQVMMGSVAVKVMRMMMKTMMVTVIGTGEKSQMVLRRFNQIILSACIHLVPDKLFVGRHVEFHCGPRTCPQSCTLSRG